MIDAPEVKAKLLSDPDVVALVGTYSSKPAIYGNPLAPSKYNGDAITMYRTSPRNDSLEYAEDLITVNCFSRKRNKAAEIQDEVRKALNRNMEGDNTFFRTSSLPIIPPQNKEGDYNAPVEVLVRQR